MTFRSDAVAVRLAVRSWLGYRLPVTSEIVNLCEACGFAVHPDNEVVRAVTITQGGPHTKPVILRGEQVILFHQACWGSGVGGFEASDRGTPDEVEAPS